MRFEWDEAKRHLVAQKHGIDFLQAVGVFETDHIILPARSTGEERFMAVGLCDGIWMAVVFTWRGENIRLITARRARQNERRAYRSLHD